MAVSHFDRFLAEATVPDPDPTRCVDIDQLFGLYISWCNVQQQIPDSEHVFRAAMKRHGINTSAPGLRKTGPAAMDYILASYPALP
ncbi:hypothetical protein [Arthrobacter celericrescens]|uniref:hypothetical protein n=1 Tax=Arthrobacter celericrescens TaxID=2320851 RepID=UPI000EA19716|nr:hypothetical protein [Arthrobacter celericrescens]